MDPMRQLQRLGWEWRPDGAGTGAGPGVLLTVRVSGRNQSVFVPLARVWLAFDDEMQKVGCVGAAMVGAPFSVGGFFSFVKKAAHSVSSVAKKAVPTAIKKAAAKVDTLAHRAVATVSRVPVLGRVALAAATLTHLPQLAAVQLLEGKRVDHIAVDSFKNAVRSVRTVAPYVQTVISVVPGLGTGLSAGIGGALALAEGQTITQAVEQAVRSSLPGGPLAAAAFDVAAGVMQGRAIDTIALNALPIGANEKKLLARGLAAAKALAAGQRVDQVLLDTALHSLPPNLQRAVQVGTALGHAKNLQGALGAAAHGAQQLAGQYAAGTKAAQLFAQGHRSPQITHALQQAHAAKGALTQIVTAAQKGHPQATHLINALQRMRSPLAPLQRPRFA